MTTFPNINFLVACKPNWVDHGSTIVTPGGEVASLPASNVQTKEMGRVWRTPSLASHYTQLLIDYGSGNLRPSRALVVGNINLPASQTLVRVQKGDFPPETQEVFPKLNTNNGGYESPIVQTNVSGNEENFCDGDFLAPTLGNYSSHASSSPGRLQFYLHSPAGRTRAGRCQLLRVWIGTNDDPADNPTLEIKVRLGTTTLLATKMQTGFPQVASGLGIVDVWFEIPRVEGEYTAPELTVDLLFTEDAGTRYYVDAVRWYAATDERVVKPTKKATFESSTNLPGGSVPADLETDSIFAIDAAHPPAGIVIPADTVGDFYLRWDSPPEMGDGVQMMVVRYSAAEANPVVNLSVLDDAALISGVTATTTQTGGNHWAVVLFEKPVGAVSAELTAVVTAHDDGNHGTVTINAIEWFLATAIDAVVYDSGFIEGVATEDDAQLSGWDMRSFDEVGRRVQNSIAVPYFSDVDQYDNPLIATVDTRYTLVEVMWDGGPEGFDINGQAIEYLDVGRVAEGPGLFGMNMAGGFSVDCEDTSRVEVSDGGVPWEDVGETYRVARIRLSQLNGKQAMRDIFEYLIRRGGQCDDLLLMIFPDIAQFRATAFAWGPPVQTPKITHQQGTSFAAELAIRERI